MGLHIDDKGNMKLTGQVVGFLRVAPADLKTPGSIENIEDEVDEDLTDEEIEQLYQKKLSDFVDSESWEIARTVYVSFSLNGHISIDKNFDKRKNFKHVNADSLLSASLNSLDISKLEVFLGDQTDETVEYNPVKGKESDDDEDDDDYEDDEDDEDGSSNQSKQNKGKEKGKTQEGGMIQALINLQLKHYLKDMLPNIKQAFYTDSTVPQIFNCYGIYIEPPQLKYFSGGFLMYGNYKIVQPNEEMCLDMTSNPIDLFINNLAPDDVKDKLNIL